VSLLFSKCPVRVLNGTPGFCLKCTFRQKQGPDSSRALIPTAPQGVSAAVSAVSVAVSAVSAVVSAVSVAVSAEGSAVNAAVSAVSAAVSADVSYRLPTAYLTWLT
jgi:hypothetical protein